ncbi:hypothetical protein Golob_000933 [Gossypium lobatum]|uniref:pectinesterase n=1 Tax=Gossypium lobatum TaxID=34289 RepID=A0A7J8N9N5_9ROSI|nr:hypothetical protein [Gossypium lobatum]
MQHKVPFLLMLLTLSLRISKANADECTGNGGSKFGYPIVVYKSDGGNFTSVQSTIDSIPQENHQWVKVQINPSVTIPKQKPCIFLEGQDRSVTTITFDAHNRTDESATFTSMADDIVAKVAARILGDKSAFFECGFLGLQDMLWDASGRHYFAKCHIEGAAGFIFGSGQSTYHACEINVTACALSSQYPYGYITSQGQLSSNDTSGFVFKGGTLLGNVRLNLG